MVFDVMFAEAAQGFDWSGVLTPAMAALFALLGYIAMKVHKHDVADAKLKMGVKAVKKDVRNLDKKVDEGFDRLDRKVDERFAEIKELLEAA